MYRPPGDHAGSCSSPGIVGSGRDLERREVQEEQVELAAPRALAGEDDLGPVGRDRGVLVGEGVRGQIRDRRASRWSIILSSRASPSPWTNTMDLPSGVNTGS